MKAEEKNTILVCISSSKSNSTVIKKANELSIKENAKLIALYISDKDSNNTSENSLENNIDLAEKLGAMVEIIYSDDIANEIINFAKLYKVQKIVIGRNTNQKKIKLRKSICDQVLEKSKKTDVYIVPVNEDIVISKPTKSKSSLKDYFISISVLILSTLLGLFFFSKKYDESNIIMIYILGNFIIALLTYNPFVSSLSSVISVLLFNFYFTEPRFSLQFYNKNYLVTFIVLFIVSFTTSRLASIIQKNSENSSNMIQITKVLLETNQLLQEKISKSEIIETSCMQLSNLLKREIVYYAIENNAISEPVSYTSEKSFENTNIDSNEKSTANFCFVTNKSCGASTRYISDSKYIYFPIRINTDVCGVLGIYLDKDRFNSVENKILLSIIGDMKLALEKEKIIRDKNEVALIAKNEELRANLLRSISHDLRTPLTTICGNSDILIHNSSNLTEDMKVNIYKDIYDDSIWLLNIIENLLYVTKIEDNNLKLKIEPQSVEEVIEEAVKHINRNKKNRKIHVDIKGDYLIADMDVRLIMQVIVNLLDNAIKYSDEQSDVYIEAYKDTDNVIIKVADNGYGIKDEDKDKVFQKFYTNSNTISDGKRSIGLGLYLCKVILKAHGGNITVTDNTPKGSVFIITLKSSKINLE